MKKLKHKGFLYSLYIANQFIEYFDSADSAMAYISSNSCYKGAEYFVKPVAFFTMEEE